MAGQNNRKPTQEDEIAKALSVYDKPARPIPLRQSGFTKIGKITGRLQRSPEAFKSVPERKVDDPEKTEKPLYVLPPPVQRGKTWKCEHCGYTTDGEYDYGYLRGQDGKPEPCPTCWPAVKRARARRLAAANIKPLVQGLILSDMQNLPENAWVYSLADYPGDEKYKQDIRAFASGGTKELMLIGEPGRGKTGLAISAAHIIKNAGGQVLFMTFERYLDLLKENFAPNAKNNNIKATLAGVETLILDDIGAGSLSESGFNVKEAQDLIEARHASGLRTLITSNMTIDGLAGFWYMKSYEKAGFQPGQRVVSRLKGWYRVVEIVGSDLRQGE